MRYYKYLDLDWKPSSQRLQTYLFKENMHMLGGRGGTWVPTDGKDILAKCPELIEMVKPLGVTIRYVAFVIHYYRTGLIHIDADEVSACRINIPVYNCENTETRFFTTNKPPERMSQPNRIEYLHLDPADCNHVDTMYLTQAVLLRNTAPHQVVINPMGLIPRISCTISLNEDLSHMLGGS